MENLLSIDASRATRIEVERELRAALKGAEKSVNRAMKEFDEHVRKNGFAGVVALTVHFFYQVPKCAPLVFDDEVVVDSSVVDSFESNDEPWDVIKKPMRD